MAATIHRSDLQIHDDAVAELNWDARFDPAELGVEVDDGVITLRGTVSTYAKLRAATELVARIPGVRAVVNDLSVRAHGDDDVSLATRARTALEMDADVPNERIDCLVRDGRVTLRGSVDHAYQREAAEAAVAHVSGLHGLDIEIDIRGHTRDDEEIARDLADALARRVAWAALVRSEVQNGIATLSGRVPTLADRLAAEATAWRTRGVRHVIDRIGIIGDRPDLDREEVRAMNERSVGHVTHYYGHLGVAAVALSEELRVGDRVHVVGHTTDATATVDRMQVDHRDVPSAKPGDDVAVHLGVKVREHDELRRTH